MDESCEGMSQRAIEAVLDTSALYLLLKRLGRNAASFLIKLVILDLTRYELGNALLKEYKLGLLEKLGGYLKELVASNRRATHIFD
jgi:predicted nucleic acid-binding protein